MSHDYQEIDLLRAREMVEYYARELSHHQLPGMARDQLFRELNIATAHEKEVEAYLTFKRRATDSIQNLKEI